MAVTQIDSNNFQPDSGIFSPTISNIQVTNSSYTVLDDTAVSTTGGFIKITGTRFNSGIQVYIGSVLATSISLVNSTVLNVQVPAIAAGSYDVVVVNTDGTYGIKPIGITFSPINITWVTSSSLGPYVTGVAISLQLNATGAIGYQLQGGSTLPPGLTLTSGGLLSGTVNVVSNTTYSFTIEASDSELQDAPRTFSLSVNLFQAPSAVEYLVVAGGGGGAGFTGGGGGAGGYRTATGFAISLGSPITVTVGGAGAGGSGTGSGTQGGNSVFSTITSVGGGAGGRNQTAGGTGGSGGGAGHDAAGGTATSGQGNIGGNGGSQPLYGGGGGGGASAVGQTGKTSSTTGGNGGDGLASAISGASVTYAGGGGGGVYASNNPAGQGGAGGGGNGGNDTLDPTAGTTNTGSGGGGQGSNKNNGAAGGSGVVIIRYADSFTAATSTTGSPTYTVTGGFRIYRFTGSGSITF